MGAEMLEGKFKEIHAIGNETLERNSRTEIQEI